MSEPLLEVSDVGKDFAKLEGNAGRLRVVLDLLRARHTAKVFTALDGISFTLGRGESLGLIGENGAGKSTLLKIIAGVATPTRGRVVVRGRIGALLELGSGFHPDYTGLENIELAAALIGVPPREIARKRSEIIAFADIGEHIHDPIKHYSSGMIVRLGFAVATALAPDVLITDEVLAVGDESFQKKCLAWMENYIAGGGTLLLCTHSMAHVQKMCRQALWLKDGRTAQYGEAASVTQRYLQYHDDKTAQAKRPPGLADAAASPAAAAAAAAAGYYVLKSLLLRPGPIIPQQTALVLEGEVVSPDGRMPVVLVGIVRSDGTPVYGVSTDMDHVPLQRLAPDRFGFELEFPLLTLLPGSYVVRAHVLDPEGVRLFDTLEKPLSVEGKSDESGLVKIAHRWSSS